VTTDPHDVVRVITEKRWQAGEKRCALPAHDGLARIRGIPSLRRQPMFES
jgi:hypothetical protein